MRAVSGQLSVAAAQLCALTRRVVMSYTGEQVAQAIAASDTYQLQPATCTTWQPQQQRVLLTLLSYMQDTNLFCQHPAGQQ